MSPRAAAHRVVLAACLISLSVPSAVRAQTAPGNADVPKKDGLKKDNDRDVRSNADLWAQIKHPVLWHQPSGIAGLNLFAGQGGADKMPEPPFTFEEEDKNGTNPKMDIRDANGKKWRVKTGEEARPEVVASRLLWAVGYFVNDDYVLPQVQVSNVTMSRGTDDVKHGSLTDARFERKPSGQDKIGTWAWKTNPFYGSREFNGLRVMMAVLNNWDLKDENNSVYQDKKTGEQIFLVNDVGASFGSNGLGLTRSYSKGNVKSYERSKFITRQTNAEVDFATPKAPVGMLLLSGGGTVKSYAMRKDLDWIGDHIPRSDAKWIGSLLAQLSHTQIVDAFRAGHFPQSDIDTYVSVVESRIAELKGL